MKPPHLHTKNLLGGAVERREVETMKLNYWREHISVIGYHFFFLIDHEIEAPKEGWN